jgi:prevent-host-death family protein
MKKASITELKNSLSAFVDYVKGGSPVLIVDRGRPVARLEPVHGTSATEARLVGLVRDGTVRAPRGSASNALFTTPPPRPRRGASAVRLLIDERRQGR